MQGTELTERCLALPRPKALSATVEPNTPKAKGKGKAAIARFRAAMDRWCQLRFTVGFGVAELGPLAAPAVAERALTQAVQCGSGEGHGQSGRRQRRQLPPAQALAHRRGGTALQLHVQLVAAYYVLGRLLGARGDHSAQRRLYTQAVTQGLWHNTLQRPGFLALAVGTTKPWP